MTRRDGVPRTPLGDEDGPAAATVGSHPAPEGTGHPRRRTILWALAAALLMMSTTVMAVTVALPTIARDLRATTGQLQWITEATVLALAALLITMGAIGDRYGRRRVLLAGLAVLVLAALLAAVATGPGELIAARALLGVGNAMVMPATLGIIRSVFPRDELAYALAVWAGVAGLGVVLGPMTGGLLVEHLGWRAVFLAMVPVLPAVGVAVVLVVPPTAPDRTARPDLLGMALVSGGLVAVVHAIIEAPRRGVLGEATLLGAGAAVILLGGFLARQRRTRHPMLDLRMVADHTFWPAAMAAATGFFALMGMVFLLTQYFQEVLGHSPSGAALLLLPIAAGQLAMAPITPRLIDRIGLRWTVSGGLGVLAVGLTLIPTGVHTDRHGVLLIGLFLLAAGNGAAVTAASTAMLGAAGTRQAGSVAAVIETAFKLGGSLGVAVLGGVLAGRLADHLASHTAALPAAERAFAGESISGALQSAALLGGPAGDRFTDAARQAFTAGLTHAAVLAACLALGAAVLTASTLHEPDRTHRGRR
ncbi:MULTISPECIES: MFS transporter [Actinoalloteichus]|uniref:Arabinose efflux permease family protein n=1 Tax=Actinoalloteichus fjordicus TaxID=1612552 RepID=A0AAC9LE14_9PSEU|nr:MULTISPECIES: MFS transporter [Actinoalloteichus]APU15135.1 arabinose efflux permease family protein [Actinoalloteichus fjordicus]APU21203.1 arabinose efflux permease family protein [Actinoalloteichus sp. GBA129-24]